MGYTEAQRALALEIVARHGGEVSAVALDEIRNAIGLPTLPKSTIWRWLQRDATDKKAASPEARAKAAEALDKMFENIARQYLSHAGRPEIVADLDGKAAVTAAAIATDKMRLLRDLPTEIVSVLPEVIEALGGTSEAVAVFRELMERRRAAKQAAEVGANV